MNAVPRPRDVRLDAMRGLFLIIMVGVHVPTPMSNWFPTIPGCVGAADGFIFLSACLAGLVYGKVYQQTDWCTLCQRIRHRVKLIYGVHLLILIPTILAVWAVAGCVAPLAAHFSDFLDHPCGAVLPSCLCCYINRPCSTFCRSMSFSSGAHPGFWLLPDAAVGYFC